MKPPRPVNGLLPIALIVFIDVLGFAVVIPLLPFYAQRYDVGPAMIGLLLASYALCSLVAAPLLGRWSDRYGRRRVLLLSQAGSLAGFLLLAWAPSLGWLFAARIVDGLSSGNVATARAYIADITAPADRTRAFGVISAAFGFGFLVGPATAGVLGHLDPRLPLLTAAALAAASIAATWWMLPAASAPPSPQPPRTAASTTALWRLPGVGPRLAQLFAFLLAFSAFSAGFPLFCERQIGSRHGELYGLREVGLLLAYVGALGLLTQLWLLPRMLRAVGEAALVRIALAVAALGYAGLAFAHSLAPLLLCLSLSGIATSALRPGLLGLISQQVPATRQGAAFGAAQSLQSLAMVLAPLAAGALIEFGWLAGWAGFCAAMLLAAMVLAPRRPAYRR